MSLDETVFINSQNRDSEDLDDLIMNWHQTGQMFPDSRGVIPPSASTNQLDTPAWSADSDNRGMGTSSLSSSSVIPNYIKVDGVLQKNPAYSSENHLGKYITVNGITQLNPNYIRKGTEEQPEARYYSAMSRRMKRYS